MWRTLCKTRFYRLFPHFLCGKLFITFPSNFYKKIDICTNCTNIFFFVEKWRDLKIKLSTLFLWKNVIKSTFPQSYPHYPQKNRGIVWITFCKKRTSVLWINNENHILSKNFYKKSWLSRSQNTKNKVETIQKIQTIYGGIDLYI